MARTMQIACAGLTLSGRDVALDHSFEEHLETTDFTAPTFEAALNAHGMYETMRFVLRLSPRNHELVGSIPLEGRISSEISRELLRAYSTYLHETVHWWQHVGSTSGFLLSLSYLGQSHSTISFLREVLAQFGPKKSLLSWTNGVLLAEGDSAQTKLAAANTCVNNAIDVEFYKAYAMNPKVAIQWMMEKNHFESVGHSYHIVYGQLLGMLQESIDLESAVIPDPEAWEVHFLRLRDDRHEGFFWGSPVRVPSVGLHAIYEGQARFIQLQFLNCAQSCAFSCEQFRNEGFFEGVYVQAFETFLELSDSEWPQMFDDPIVSLFLLVCDLAINPTRGLPLDIEHFENFIRDVDVGVRFTVLCQAVSRLPHLKKLILEHSKNEYTSVSEELTSTVGYDNPLDALEVVDAWKSMVPGLERLMEEHRTFKFDKKNLPVRVLFSHFVSFSRDRLSRPEFFCWPGKWKVGRNASEEINKLWLRHLSLFSDHPEKPGVYARKWPEREEAAVLETFNNFYGTMAVYDLTRQWILKDGPFVCDYRWMMETYSQESAEAWASDTFKQVFGVALDSFEIIPPESQ
jgi:hypothetical protein